MGCIKSLPIAKDRKIVTGSVYPVVYCINSGISHNLAAVTSLAGNKYQPAMQSFITVRTHFMCA